ncbi:hypothetical protein TYRP_006053 [Tyrophagus putrescentiae]|nr:hypothetical protein TYRP_006053 [Tyrophagus putrescentiae]
MSADLLGENDKVFYKEEENDDDSTSCSSSLLSEATTRMGNAYHPHRRSSAPVAAAAAAATIANFRKKSLAMAVEPTTAKKRQFIRRVERFGADLADPCLFPLALPMDGSDIYKGASTWESLNLLADCVLTLWTEATEERRKKQRQQQQSSTVQSHSRGWENSVLANSARYLVLQPTLTDRIFLHPDCRLPFRRTASETDLSALGIVQGEKDGLVGMIGANHRNKVNRNLATAQMSVGGESVYSIVSDNDLFEGEAVDGHECGDRNRSRSSLTTAYLGKRAASTTAGTSLKEQARQQRKDRFNLNLTKNMKTEARKLAASRSQLERNAYKFAKRISKLEKRYYLAVDSREFMALVFKKGGGGGGGGGSGAQGKLLEMIEFGLELSQLVADLICTEFTVEDQGSLLATIIETAFTLHQKGNLQSFKSVMRGLQLPDVYRLRSAWKVLRQKFPLHLRVFSYLTVLLHRKVDHTMLHSSAPCLPTLAAFVELLRIRCLSIWDQLEAVSETATLTLPSKDTHHHHHHQWKTTPSNGLVTLLAAHPVDERRLEETVSAKLTSDLKAKLKRYQLKQQQQLKKKKKGRWDKKDGRLHSPPPPTSIPLKRLLHPESKTMATEFSSLYAQLVAAIEAYRFGDWAEG